MSGSYSLIFPTISATGGYSYKKDALTSPTALFGGETYNYYTLGLALNQPLFDGGAILGGVKVAKLNRDIADITRQENERDLTESVIESFYSVVLAKNVETLQENINVQKALLDLTTHWQKIGRSQVLDVLQMRTNLALLEPQLATAKNQVLIAASTLANYLGEQKAKEIEVLGNIDVVLDPAVAAPKVVEQVEKLPFQDSGRRSDPGPDRAVRGGLDGHSGAEPSSSELYGRDE